MQKQTKALVFKLSFPYIQPLGDCKVTAEDRKLLIM